jgi:diguanylate cyclase (GGDEF)-like protein
MVMTGRIARPAEHWTFLPHFVSTVLDVLGSRDQRRRLRLVQWIIASLVYVGAATLLITGVGQGWMGTGALYLWLGFVALILVTGYAALRSGWTERFRDPSISVWQLSMGVLAVNWGYLICGPMRTSALFPLMVIFAFGAFALRWREMAFLTVLALSSLIAAVVLRGLYPQWVPAQGEIPPVRVDINNLLMLAVVLPALAVISVRLSGLRQKLRNQREALANALAEVERLAVTDELTGIANRRSIKSLLDRSAALSSRQLTSFSVAILDLDHFKTVNDELGHAAGDAVLKAFARLASAELRNTDMLGRWGGEEFLLVLAGGREAYGRVLDRIRKAVRNNCLDARPITFSAGVAHHRADETADELLARADLALYEAKEAGRDRYVAAD